MYRREEWFVLLLCAFAFLNAGCGDGNRPTFPAGGTVTLTDGTPLSGGQIVFQLKNDPAAATAQAKIAPDGTFQLGTYNQTDGALEGTHFVLVIPPRTPRKPAWEAEMQQGRSPSAANLQIDHRYYGFDTSPLTFTVTSDASKNHFDIRLEPPRSQSRGR